MKKKRGEKSTVESNSRVGSRDVRKSVTVTASVSETQSSAGQDNERKAGSLSACCWAGKSLWWPWRTMGTTETAAPARTMKLEFSKCCFKSPLWLNAAATFWGFQSLFTNGKLSLCVIYLYSVSEISLPWRSVLEAKSKSLQPAVDTHTHQFQEPGGVPIHPQLTASPTLTHHRGQEVRTRRRGFPGGTGALDPFLMRSRCVCSYITVTTNEKGF